MKSIDKKDTISVLKDTIKTNNSDSLLDDKINFIDKNGLKQGIWKTFKGNKLIKLETFKNGKLDGLVKEWNFDNYTISFFKNDKPDSLKFFHFTFHKDNDSTLSYFIWKYENGVLLWTGYPLVFSHMGFPGKPFSLYVDTANIWIPYKNGKVFYTGTFVKYNHDGDGIGIGKHTMYYLNGKIKASYDYDLDLMKVYTKEGKPHKESNISPNNFEKLKELNE